MLGRWLCVTVLIIVFFGGCSNTGQLQEGAPSLNDREAETLVEEVATEAVSVETEEVIFPSERLILSSKCTNWLNGNILVFDDIVFVHNTEYEYRDGCYHATGKKLTDYMLPEDREKMERLIDGRCVGQIFWTGTETAENWLITLETEGGMFWMCLSDLTRQVCTFGWSITTVQWK